MKFFTSLILIAFLSFVAGLFLPWWSIAIVAFLVIALIPQRWGRAFLAGFLAIFLLWGIMSFVISQNNEHLLASKVSVLILKMENPFLLIFATAFIGGLVAGLAALTAAFLRRSPEYIARQKEGFVSEA